MQNPSSPLDYQRGKRWLLIDGICSQIMGALTGGAFLVAFALSIGASNTVVGLFAAISPLAQILQVPAIFLLDRVPRRKFLVLVSTAGSRLFWLPVVLMPFMAVHPEMQWIVVFCLVAYYTFGSVSALSFNSWMKDFVSEEEFGSTFARRYALGNALGSVLSIGAALLVESIRSKNGTVGHEVYGPIFALGMAFGYFGIFALSRIPEPGMQRQTGQKIWKTLKEPLRDKNYRNLMVYLSAWSFAVNLAAPFFTVYMLRRLELPLTFILVLSVVSQISNVFFFQIWGRISDRFSNKSALAVSGPLFVLCIFLWPFTAVPDFALFQIPILILIHVLAGVSTAGVTLCTGNIAIKLADKGKASSYLAMNSLASGSAAASAPIVGGLLADTFGNYKASLKFEWTHLGFGTSTLEPVALFGLDFVFIFACVLGLYSMHRLLAVKEEGEVEERIVLTELYTEVRKVLRSTSNVAGLRHLTHFPIGFLLAAGRKSRIPVPVLARKGKPTAKTE